MRRAALALAALAALAGAGWLWLDARRRPDPAPSQERLAALRSQRAALQERFRELTSGQRDPGLGDPPQGGLVIGVPASFTRSLVEQLVTGLLAEVRLDLADLEFKKSDEVRGKVLFGMRTFGRYDLEIRVGSVRGLLRPGAPTLGFGRQRIAVTVPVRLAEGAGRAQVRLKWDSKGLANAVCGDFDISRELTASVRPANYRLAGAFEVAADSGAIVLTPRFADLKVRLHVEPTPEAWAAVEDLLRERRALCRAALSRVDVREKLEQVVRAGFEVRVPAKLVQPIRIPAGVQQSLSVQGMDVSLQIVPAALSVGDERLWYGVDVTVSRQAAAAGAAR